MNRIAKYLIACVFVGLVAPEVPPARADSEMVLYSFVDPVKNPYADLRNVKGTLYGSTIGAGGSVFAFDPASRVATTLHSGHESGSLGHLLDVNGTLYGTTGTLVCFANKKTCGSVFSIDTVTGAFKVLHTFKNNGKDGLGPKGGLILVRSTLYGTTAYGGGTGCGGIGCGTVFSVEPTTGTVTILHAFQSTDGANPWAGLLKVNGVLYGTTANGGTSSNCTGGCGTVFSFDPATGTLDGLYSFSGTDGFYPAADLISVNGTLYGTTTEGGNSACGNGCGTVFSFDPSSGSETVLHAFSGSDGQWPVADLVDVNGVLYGTTEFGGSGNGGTVFKVTLDGKYTILHSFEATGGGRILPDKRLDARETEIVRNHVQRRFQQ